MHLELDMSLSIGAVFQIEKFKEDGTITYQGPIFHNLVLDCGLLKASNSYVPSVMTDFINIGSGTSEPVATQTGLDNRLYSTSNIFNSQKYPGIHSEPDYPFYRRVFQFNIGTCTGTFTELGLSRLSNTDYFNRQLIKDVNGNPISITVAADEGLRIMTEIRCNHSRVDVPCKYKLDLKGATAGGITFTNGTTTKTITLATMELQSDLGVTNGTYPEPNKHQTSFLTTLDDIWSSLGNVVKSIFKQTDGTYLTSMRSFVPSDPKLSIQSHTLTGGSGPPELTVVKAWEPLLTGSFVHTNETTLETKTINYFFYHYTGAITSTNAAAWGLYYLVSGGGWKNVLVDAMIGFFYLRLWMDATILPVPTSVSTTLPTVGNWKTTKTFYWSPGTLGTGTISFNRIYFENSGSFASQSGSLGTMILDQTISVTDVEEFAITASLTFERYTS